MRAAETRKSMADYDFDAAQEQLALQAVNAYMEVLRTRELVKLARDYRSILDYYTEKIRMRQSEGIGDAVQVAEAEERISFADSNVVRFQREAMLANYRYAEIIGHHPESSFQRPAFPEASIPDSIDEAVDAGLKENPRILSAQAQSRSKDWEIEAERARLYPKLNAEVSYLQREVADDAGGQTIGAQALVKLSWDFATGGSKKARVDRAAFLKVEAEEQHRALLREIERNIRNSYTEMNIAGRELALFKDRELKNKEILVSYTNQFDAGKRTFLQIVGVETRVFNSQAETVNARYKLLKAKSQLLSGLGRLRSALNVTGGKG